MRIGVLAPLVAPLREPQLGGAQALVADVAAALSGRGHDVEVVAAAGSRVEGVRVVDAGIDARALAPSVFRHDSADAEPPGPVWDAFGRAWDALSSGRYDIVHNHAFDVPAVALAPADGPPVVHTLHLGPRPRLAAALREARASVAVVSR